jgi:pimeloyl-ACP methyl ester carboxylesterase
MTSIELSDIPLGQFTFRVRSAGPADGRPVILLHGVPQTSLCWEAQLEALGGAGYHAVAFDQRGYSPGARSEDISEFTMDKLVGDVLEMADVLGFKRFDVVGHDMGAGVAWTLAAHHAERLNTLTAVSVPNPNAYFDAYHGSIPNRGDGDDQFTLSAYAREFRAAPRGVPEQLMVANDCELLRTFFDGLSTDHISEYVEVLGSVDAMRGVLDVYRNSDLIEDPGSEATFDRLPPIEVPTLFIWSDQDPAIAASGAYATGDHVKGPYRFVALEGLDHWIQEKAPERFNSELLAHLERHPVGALREQPKRT